jgi:hypothetical protein
MHINGDPATELFLGSTHKAVHLLFLMDKDNQNDRIHASFRHGMSRALKVTLCSVVITDDVFFICVIN